MNSPYKSKFRVSQQYKGSAHDGLDLVGIDSKEIHSTVDGVVEKAGWENALNHKQGFGLYVRIKKNNSVDRYYFGHLSKLNVKKGQAVKTGDVIGIEGSTGKSTGSHCHYCARGNGSKSKIKDICAISGIPNKLGVYNDTTSEKADTVDVIYRVRVGGKWLAEVRNLEDYAGIKGKAITDVAIKVTGGKVRYRVHVYKGKWLPFVTGYNLSDHSNGYAGNGKAIDAIEREYTGDHSKTIQYHVSPLKKDYYSYQVDNNRTYGQDGYAGSFGRKLDRLQIRIK